MKKRLLVAMALMVSVMMTACDGGGAGAGAGADNSDGYALYTEASEALNEADSVAMDTTMDYSIAFGEEVMEMKMAGDIKQVLKGETDMDMEMNMSMDYMGEAMDIKAYYTDGYLYQEMMGQKVKMQMDVSDALAQASTEAIVFPEDAIENLDVTEANGETTVSFTLKSSAIEDILQESLASMKDTLPMDEVDMGFSDVTLVAVIKDGEMKSTKMNFVITMEAQGEVMAMNCDMEMVITQIGGVTVDLPTDLDTYVEMPSMY